jgi:hypothetical protein
VWERLSTGRLKVFANCEPWFDEYRLYRRDTKGRIVKKHDHLTDCTRMLVRGVARLRTEQTERPTRHVGNLVPHPDHSWMG